jgi:uncharacterized protein YkwD
MVRRRYFGHTSRGGGDVIDRVNATGYGGGHRYSVEENLFWWSLKRTPAQVLRAWMASPPHRAGILGRRWRHFGLAVLMRSPFGAGGITVVGVFGVRRSG